MYEDFDFYEQHENIHNDTYQHKKKKQCYAEDNHVMDEIISILKSLITIFDIVSEHIKDKK